MGGNVNGTFHQQYLTALNNLTALCLEKAPVQEAVAALWRYVVDFICDVFLASNSHYTAAQAAWCITLFCFCVYVQMFENLSHKNIVDFVKEAHFCDQL